MSDVILPEIVGNMSVELPGRGIVRKYVCLEKFTVVLSAKIVSSKGRIWNRDALVGASRATTELR